MPEGAAPLPDVEKVRTGLAAVDLSDVASGAHTPVSRYEEYTLDDDTSPATPATPADVPAEETQAVKVTKVRKKKKDGVKKKKKVEVV